MTEIRKIHTGMGMFRILRDEMELGRGYLPMKIIPAANGGMAARMIKQGIFEYGAVYTDKKNWNRPETFNQQGRVVHKKYKSSESVFEVDSPRETLFVFANSYYKKWKASVNKINAPVLKVNAAAMAVKIPGGKSTIRFYYDDTMEKLWLFVMLFGMVLYILLYIGEIKKKITFGKKAEKE